MADLNPQIRRLIESASYDQLEELEAQAFVEGRHHLAAAIHEELKRRRDDVVDSLWNIIETIESLEWPEEE